VESKKILQNNNFKNMNFNFFKKHEAVSSQETNPTEEIKNTTEPETSPEEEISPERVEALTEYENTVKEIASLKESDLKDEIENPEERIALSEKLTLLQKISETVKDHAPELAIAAVGLGSLAIGLAQEGNLDLANSAVMSAEKITAMVASAVTAFSAVFSSILWSYKNYTKEQEVKDSFKIDNSSHAIAA
jgi:hypothetical protein